jgi:hypothetical protein
MADRNHTTSRERALLCAFRGNAPRARLRRSSHEREPRGDTQRPAALWCRARATIFTTGPNENCSSVLNKVVQASVSFFNRNNNATSLRVVAYGAWIILACINPGQAFLLYGRAFRPPLRPEHCASECCSDNAAPFQRSDCTRCEFASLRRP